jgi:alpha-L-rhamnosidase
LKEASATYESIYGTIRSGWKKDKGGVTYTFTVPVNTTATVTLAADKEASERISGIYPGAEWNDGRVKFSVGSGSYSVRI